MSRCILKRVHDSPNCSSSSKSEQVFLNDDNSYSSYCFSCGNLDRKPFPNGDPSPSDLPTPPTPEEIQAEIDEIRQAPLLDRDYRGIPASEWKKHGVRVLRSPYDGSDFWAIAHPYTRNKKVIKFKIKLTQKKVQWVVGHPGQADLYGWLLAKRAGSRVAYITEGEEDAIALQYILKESNKGTKYRDMDYACMSLSQGAKSSKKDISAAVDDLKEYFEGVVLAFDDDEEGRAAEKQARMILPGATVARLPEKDANACLKAGKIKATADACKWRAKAPVTTGLIRAATIKERILEDVQPGESWPWPSVTNLTFGQRKQELVVIAGGTGIGKTTIAHQLIAHNAQAHGWRTLGFMLEEPAKKSFRRVAGQFDRVPYHFPDCEYDPKQLEATIDHLDQYFHLWDRDLMTDPVSTWELISSTIRSIGNNVDVVVLDNATALSEGLTAAEKNEFLGTVASQFQNLAKQFDFEAIVLSHLNPVSQGTKPHENGGVVREKDLTGSRAWQRYADLIIGKEGNKRARNPNCAKVTVIKAREYGQHGEAKLLYSGETGCYSESNWPAEDYEDHDKPPPKKFNKGG